MGYSEVQDVQVGRTNLSFAFTDVGPSAVAESLLMNHQALVRTVVNRVRAAEIATEAVRITNEELLVGTPVSRAGR